MSQTKRLLAVLATGALTLTACGEDTTSGADASRSGSGAENDRPTVVVTTNILGDVVENLVGEEMDVVTVMPVGADPHDFQASAQQANQIRQADALIVNGAGFEEGLLDVIEAASDDGVPTFEAISAVVTIEFGAGGHEGPDPHFFTDPSRMAIAADEIVEFLGDTIEGIDTDDLTASAAPYRDELGELDAEVEGILEAVADENRVLVTSHEVFGYFADRYDFEVVGTVIPSGSTADGASAGELADLAEVIEAEGVRAIFADTSSSDDLAEALAGEVGNIVVVELFSESLGDEGSDGATYTAMIRTNAQRIADALG